MNVFNKTLLASAMLAASSVAYASPFYIDFTGTSLGIGYPYDDADVITGDFNHLTYKYESRTVITLANPVSGINPGDTIITTGGLDLTNLNSVANTFKTNQFASTDPSTDNEGFTNTAASAILSNPAFLGPGNAHWGLSFTVNLTGKVEQASGFSVSEVSYSGGLIEVFLLTFNGVGGILDYKNIFDLKVTGSDLSNNSDFSVFGNVSYNGNEYDPWENLFRSSNISCGINDSFFALSQCVPEVKMGFTLNQNLSEVTGAPISNNQVQIGGSHDGRLTFNIPEPASLALLGIGLLGFAGVSRRKSA